MFSFDVNEEKGMSRFAFFQGSCFALRKKVAGGRGSRVLKKGKQDRK